MVGERGEKASSISNHVYLMNHRQKLLGDARQKVRTELQETDPSLRQGDDGDGAMVKKYTGKPV